jgi:DNA-binding response OmpR family regulator
MTAQILCVEDDTDVAHAIGLVLRGGGLEVSTATDGRDGLQRFHNGRQDAVLLDVGLPTLDGWELLARIRDASDVPVLMLTAHGELSEKVRGLQSGADDYLAKPFRNAELLARVRALLRRRRSGRPDLEIFDDGRVELAFTSKEVRVDDQPVPLTPGEGRLLAVLVRQAGQILTTDELREQAWGDPRSTERPASGTGQLTAMVEQLSGKLGDACAAGSPIEAIPGAGYRYLGPAS